MKSYAQYISEKEKEADVSKRMIGEPVATHKGYTWHIVPTTGDPKVLRASPSAPNSRYEVIKRTKDGRHISHGIFDSHGGAVREVRRKTGMMPTIAEDGGGAAGGGAGAMGAGGGGGSAAPTTVTAGASVKDPVVSKARQKKIVGDGETSYKPSRVPTGIRS